MFLFIKEPECVMESTHVMAAVRTSIRLSTISHTNHGRPKGLFALLAAVVWALLFFDAFLPRLLQLERAMTRTA